MSLWTDRELKQLIHRVNELEMRLSEVERKAGPPDAMALLRAASDIDKRSKEYREWKNANS
jgi:hypothetical protein